MKLVRLRDACVAEPASRRIHGSRRRRNASQRVAWPAADLQLSPHLHEQAAAIAAEAYAQGHEQPRRCAHGHDRPGWHERRSPAWRPLGSNSIPSLILSGQVKRADLKGTPGVRILGVQEVDIVSIVTSITKYAVTVTDPAPIGCDLDKAVYLARTGRRGPVWLDIPLDVQAAQIDPDALAGFPAPCIGTDHELADKIRA